MLNTHTQTEDITSAHRLLLLKTQACTIIGFGNSEFCSHSPFPVIRFMKLKYSVSTIDFAFKYGRRHEVVSQTLDGGINNSTSIKVWGKVILFTLKDV
jgi:hypothetical protein